MKALIPPSPRPILTIAIALTATILAAATSVRSTKLDPSPRAAEPSPPGGDGVSQWHRCSLIASAGVVDEADVDEVVYTAGRVSPKLTVTNGTIVLRYDIQPGYVGSAVDLSEAWLFVRYKDNGDGSRIRAKLRTFDVTDGTSNTLLTFDSNDWAQSEVIQRHSVSDTSGSIDYDAFQSYYVEVTIDKTSSAGRPEMYCVEVWLDE